MKTMTTILCISIFALAITACGPLEQDQSIDEQAFALEEAEEEESPWRTHQFLVAYAKGNPNIYFRVDDWGLSWDSEASSRFTARASEKIDGKIKFYYRCEIENPKVDNISRLPDTGSFIGPNGPNKALSYTLEAPACEGYPAATFTVSCSADKACHSNTSGQTKNTLPDGTHSFSSYQREDLSGSSCTGRINNCTVTFDNRTVDGGGVLLEPESFRGYASAYEERRREAAK